MSKHQFIHSFNYFVFLYRAYTHVDRMNSKIAIEKRHYDLKNWRHDANRVVSCTRSLQEILLAGFRVRDLVDDDADSALGDNIGSAIAQLDGYHGLRS